MAENGTAPTTENAVEPSGVVWSLEVRPPGGAPVWTWSHLDLASVAGRARLNHGDGWPPGIQRQLTGQDETPRVVAFGDTIGGVLPSYPRDGGPDAFEPIYWHFAAAPDRIVTARRHASRTMAAGYHASAGLAPPRDPAALLLFCIADFARAVRLRLADLSDELDAIEDTLLDRRGSAVNAGTASLIGQIRREAIMVKRAMTPVSRALDENEDELPAWWHGPELDPTHSMVVGVLDDIGALNERAQSLQDELSSRLAEETNQRLYIVSVVTTLVMPATFVTGFFGMNTGGLLWGGDGAPMGTFYATLTCVAAVVLMVMLLKRKHLL